METAKRRRRAQWQENKEIRPTWFYWDAREASSWEIIFFAAYLKKQHKGGDEGCEHRQTFPSISTILFLLSISTLFIIFLEASQLVGYFQRRQRIWEKQNYKKQGWMLPLSIHFTDTRILHRPSFVKTNNMRIIQDWLAISSKTHLLRFPKNTNFLKKQI